MEDENEKNNWNINADIIFVGLFLFFVQESGFKITLLAFGITAVIVVWVCVAVYLIE